MRRSIRGLALWLSLSALACSDDASTDEAEPVLSGDYELRGDAIEALRGVRIVTGSLKLSEVNSLAALAQLAEVHGDLIITDSPKLASLQGLDQLTRVDGRLSLLRLPAVTALRGLGALEQVGGPLGLEQLDALTDLRGLPALRRVGGDLRVSRNIKLTTLTGLEGDGITSFTVGGDLVVSDNDALTAIDFGDNALSAPYVHGAIWIRDNAALRETGNVGRTAGRTGLCGIDKTGLWITGNAALERVTLLTELWDDACISITDNAQLTSIVAPSGGRIGGLQLYALPNLQTLEIVGTTTRLYALDINQTGLGTLAGVSAQIECSLSISNNSALSELGGLEQQPGPVANWLSISGNPLLPQCSVAALIKQLPEVGFGCVDPEQGTVPRTRTITGSQRDTDTTCEAR